MWLADTSIKRPVFATMFIMALVVIGIISYPGIGVDLYPKVDFPIVNITTVLKGASPEVMDVDVTDKVEEAVNTINGVKSIQSMSVEGASVVTIEFVLERDIDLAVQDVREKVSAIRSKLPTDAVEPVIEKVDPDTTPVIWLDLTGNRPVRELSTYADEILKEKFQRIPEVGAIRMSGLRLRQARVWIDADRMRAFEIAPSDLIQVLQRENLELPGGRIESASKEYEVKIKGELSKVADFNDLVVSYYKGAPVRLRDIGRVEDGMEEKRTICRMNGLPAVGMGIQKQSGTNTVEVINRVKAELVTIKKNLPPGMDIIIAFDQSTFIQRSISEVQHHLIIGGFLAVLAVLIFLKNWRTTIISALALPVSVIATFALIKVFNFTFNNMTMLALSLSIGILIDDAIIVIENIHRHIEEGMDPKKAASYATSEIGLAVMATTLAIIVIFLPVAFMKGLIGRFFLQFALTVVFSVFVSLIVSFTLTPMAASIFMKAHQKRKDIAVLQPSAWQRIMKGWDGFNDRSAAWYRKLLAISLRHRGIVLLIAFVIFVCSLFITKFIGKEFLPPEDQGVFLARLQAPADYSVDQADALFKKAETIMRGLPEVKTVFYIQGYGRTVEVNKAVLFVTLKPKSERQKSQETIKKEIRLRFLEIPGLKGYAEDVSMIGGGQRMVPIQYSIRGTDFSALQTYSKQVVNEFSKLPGIVDVDTSQEATKPELKIYIDRDKAADLGLSVASVAEAVNLLIGGEVDITKYKDEERGRRYDLRVRLNPQDRSNPDDLGRIYVRAQDGRLVEVSNVIRIKEGGGPSVINRLDRQRAVTVFASLEGKPLGQAIQELDAISARILPVDFVPKYKGMAETMGESFRYLLFALVFGIIMAYMVLASQFESFVHPFTVLLSMPLSFIGAFGALFLTGKTINIFSLIGLILLMGIVKKNAILLIDYTNTLRTRGLSRQEAILQAGPVRLRPILMTTFAMVFGMLPVAMGLGEGSETRSPMGIAVIGGLLSSLFLTLVVVPVAYDLFDDVQAFIVRRNRRGLGKTDEKGRSAIEESHSADHDQSASAVLERKSDGSN